MLIHEMTEDECGTALEQIGFGRLACVRRDQPYIVPIYFSYDRKHLYGVTTLGQKIEWMRSNPLVCLEIDERTSHYQWTSVVCLVATRSYRIRQNMNMRERMLSKFCRNARCGGSRLA
jgi:uncharacterized protein